MFVSVQGQATERQAKLETLEVYSRCMHHTGAACVMKAESEPLSKARGLFYGWACKSVNLNTGLKLEEKSMG